MIAILHPSVWGLCNKYVINSATFFGLRTMTVCGTLLIKLENIKFFGEGRFKS